MDTRERSFRITTGIIYDLLRQITFPEEEPLDIRERLQEWQETAIQTQRPEVRPPGVEATGEEGPSEIEISEKTPSWPVSSRSASPVESPNKEQQSHGRICVRCLKSWKPYVQAEEPIPECTFNIGNGRYKCDDCSRKRVSCDIVSKESRYIKNILISVDTAAASPEDYRTEARDGGTGEGRQRQQGE